MKILLHLLTKNQVVFLNVAFFAIDITKKTFILTKN